MKHASRIVPMIHLRRMAAGAGSHWFDLDTLRFFRSRLPREAYQGADGRWYFISSEQFQSRSYTAPRLYSVRVAGDNWSSIESYGPGFQGYATRSQALSGLRRALKEAAESVAGKVN